MAPFGEPLHPVLYRLPGETVPACTKRGKPMPLCGEMASQPAWLLPLLGMGLRSLSQPLHTFRLIAAPALRLAGRRKTSARCG
jgi:phosphotransferase system enzyme I (PtsI)